MLFVYTAVFVVSNHMVLDQLQKMLKGRYAILDIEHVYAFEGLSNMLEKTFPSKTEIYYDKSCSWSIYLEEWYIRVHSH